MSGDVDGGGTAVAAVPAATVLLLRTPSQVAPFEVLMLRKNAKIAFGGMWVFPGGRIEAQDGHVDENSEVSLAAARVAAAREAQEGLRATLLQSGGATSCVSTCSKPDSFRVASGSNASHCSL